MLRTVEAGHVRRGLHQERVEGDLSYLTPNLKSIVLPSFRVTL